MMIKYMVSFHLTSAGVTAKLVSLLMGETLHISRETNEPNLFSIHLPI